MSTDLNILIIDTDNTYSAKISGRLKRMGYSRFHTGNHDIPLELIGTLKPDLVLFGAALDTLSCEKNLYKINIVSPSIPILSSSDEWNKMEAANSCFMSVYSISSDPDEDELKESVDKVLNKRMEREALSGCPIIVGHSKAVRNIRANIQKVANTSITVLITGETGTGKELIARGIHFNSPRKEGPLVKVDCASLPDELLESEVFGFQKGAFTDAYRDKPGRLELADGGTLFIDEIGDLSLSLQVKFLQVLEDKTFARLGGTEDKQVDARVVAATNSDLWKKVREGAFRKDLFFRLKIMNIESPPLRERKDDIPLLIQYFQNKYSFEFKKENLDIPLNVLDLLISYRWPGNVRELENMIKRAIAMRDWNFVIEEIDLEKIDNNKELESDSGEETIGVSVEDDNLKKLFEENNYSLKKITKAFVSEAEQKMIIKILEENRWNRTKAAKVLNTSYRTLLSRIEEFGLKE